MTTEPRLQINNNGTDPLELLALWQRVQALAAELGKALEAAAPHGRDYQTDAWPTIAFNEDRSAWLGYYREVEALEQWSTEVTEEIARQASYRRDRTRVTGLGS